MSTFSTTVITQPSNIIRLFPNKQHVVFGTFQYLTPYHIIELLRRSPSMARNIGLRQHTAEHLDYALTTIQEFMYVSGQDQIPFRPVLGLNQNERNVAATNAPTRSCTYRRCMNGALELSFSNLWSRSLFTDNKLIDPQITFQGTESLKIQRSGRSYIANDFYGGIPFVKDDKGTFQLVKPKYVRLASLRVGIGATRELSGPQSLRSYTSPSAEDDNSGELRKWHRNMRIWMDFDGNRFSEELPPRHEWLTTYRAPNGELGGFRKLEIIGFSGNMGNQPSYFGEHLIGTNQDDKPVYGPMLLGTFIYWSGFINGQRKYAAAFVGSASPDYVSTKIQTLTLESIGPEIRAGVGDFIPYIKTTGPIKLHEITFNATTGFSEVEIPIATDEHAPSPGFGQNVILQLSWPNPTADPDVSHPPQQSGYCAVALQFSPALIDYHVPHVPSDAIWATGNWGRPVWPQQVFINQDWRVGGAKENLSITYHRDPSTGEITILGYTFTKRLIANTPFVGIRSPGLARPEWFHIPQTLGTAAGIPFTLEQDLLSIAASQPFDVRYWIASKSVWQYEVASARRAVFFSNLLHIYGLSGMFFSDDPVIGGLENFGYRSSISRFAIFRALDNDRFLMAPRAFPIFPQQSNSGCTINASCTLHYLRVLDCDDSIARGGPMGRAVPSPLRFDDITTCASLDRRLSPTIRRQPQEDAVGSMYSLDWAASHYYGPTQKVLEDMITSGLLGFGANTLDKYIAGKYTTLNAAFPDLRQTIFGQIPFSEDPGGAITKRKTMTTWEVDDNSTPLLKRHCKVGTDPHPERPYLIDSVYDLEIDELIPLPPVVIKVTGMEFAAQPMVRTLIDPLSIPFSGLDLTAGYYPFTSPPIEKPIPPIGLKIVYIGNKIEWSMSGASGSYSLSAPMPPTYHGQGQIGHYAWTGQKIEVWSSIDLGASVTVRCKVLRCVFDDDLFNDIFAPTTISNIEIEPQFKHGMFADVVPLSAAAPSLTITESVRALTIPKVDKTSNPIMWYYLANADTAGLTFERKQFTSAEIIDTQYESGISDLTRWGTKITGTIIVPHGTVQNPTVTINYEIHKVYSTSTSPQPGYAEIPKKGGAVDILINYQGTSVPGMATIDGVDAPWI